MKKKDLKEYGIYVYEPSKGYKWIFILKYFDDCEEFYGCNQGYLSVYGNILYYDNKLKESDIFEKRDLVVQKKYIREATLEEKQHLIEIMEVYINALNKCIEINSID